MAATRAGMRVAAISSDGPRWLDGSAGVRAPSVAGPKLCSSAGWLTQLHVDSLLLVAPRQISEGEPVAGLHRLDHVAELRLARDRRPVGGDDDVAADQVGLARDEDRGAPGLRGRRRAAPAPGVTVWTIRP